MSAYYYVNRTYRGRSGTSFWDATDANYKTAGIGFRPILEVLDAPPTTPPSITVPESVRSGKPLNISWGLSSDPEGGPVTYDLQRSVNGGGFARVYYGPGNIYTDNAIDTTMNMVQYRVRSEDVQGAASAFVTSPARTVNHNSDPTISGSDSDLGNLTEPPTLVFSVDDADAGDVLTVYLELDGAVIQTIQNAERRREYSFTLTQKQFAQLSNGPHSIAARVVDSAGNQALRMPTFARIVEKISYIAHGEIEEDSMPESILASLRHIAPEGLLSVQTCNNYLDENPVWENVIIGQRHLFANAEKTAEKWQAALWVTIEKQPGQTVISHAVGGIYKTEDGGEGEI